MTKIYQIQTLKELEKFKDMIGHGTYNTAEHSITQGKPTFIAVVDDEQV